MKQKHLVFMRQDQLGGALRGQDLERVGLKGQNNRAAAPRLCVLDHPLQKRLVTEVNTVEVAQRQDGPTQGQVSILYMAKDIHDQLKKPAVISARLSAITEPLIADG